MKRKNLKVEVYSSSQHPTNMSTKKWIDKKKAETYRVVYRPRDDPLAYDEDASQTVLAKVDNLNTREQKTERKDKWNKKSVSGRGMILTDEDAQAFQNDGRRENEGEAALYGITYDDSKYDYMQHLRPIGSDSSAVFIAKKDLNQSSKAKGDILLRSSYANQQGPLLPDEVLPSKDKLKLTYQDQQNIPDEIAGFQPDMDPDLREVLEALEDEEYVENEERDYFEEIVASGKAPDIVDDEDDFWDEDDELDGFVSDDEPRPSALKKPIVEAKEGEEDWETAFRQFKIDQEYSKKSAGYEGESEDEDQVASLGGFTATTMGRRAQLKKKKKGKKARSDASGFSMSSSAIFRNEGLTLLDDRFDKIEEEYEGEEDQEDPGAFDMSKERADLESIMDDFLENFAFDGRKMVKK